MCRRRSSKERLTMGSKPNRRRRKVSSGEQLADCCSDSGGRCIVLCASCRHRVRIVAGLDLMDKPVSDVVCTCVCTFAEALFLAAVLEPFLVVGGRDQRREPMSVGRFRECKAQSSWEVARHAIPGGSNRACRDGKIPPAAFRLDHGRIARKLVRQGG